MLSRTRWPTGVHPQWQWADLPDQTGSAPLRFRLHAGPAVVEVLGRQDGAHLDAIRLDAVGERGE